MKKLLPIILTFLSLIVANSIHAQILELLPNVVGQLDESTRKAFFEFQDEIELEDLMEQLSAENYIDEFGNILEPTSQFNIFFKQLVAGLGEISAEDYAGNFELLNDQWEEGFSKITPKVETNRKAIVEELMDPFLFPNIEMATGIKQTSVKYYRNENLYSAEPLLVVRLGTAPIFDRRFTTRWSIAGSWDTDKNPATIRLNASEYVNDQIIDQGNNPVLIDGDFALMYNPGIRLGSITNARLLTSLGMELGTYVPAHQSTLGSSNLRTNENKGFTTSCAAQMGTGLSYQLPGFSVYVLGTIAYGSVINSPGYIYRSKKLTTGILIGPSVSIRYSTGHQQWAPSDNKNASTLHEFTIGLMLGKRKREKVKQDILDSIEAFN